MKIVERHVFVEAPDLVWIDVEEEGMYARREVADWLHEHVGPESVFGHPGRWETGYDRFMGNGGFWFQTSEDAMMFKLRWR